MGCDALPTGPIPRSTSPWPAARRWTAAPSYRARPC